MQGEYEKGYDRLTAGPAFSQSIGWIYLDPRNNYNFSIDLEVSEGFTKSYRSYDFNTRMADTRKRLDMFYGIKAGLYFPFYKRSSDGFYYE
jgi:hypothetical protein